MDDASGKFASVVLRARASQAHQTSMRSGLQVVTSMSDIASCIQTLRHCPIQEAIAKRNRRQRSGSSRTVQRLPRRFRTSVPSMAG
jgi:hypothetical protein